MSLKLIFGSSSGDETHYCCIFKNSESIHLSCLRNAACDPLDSPDLFSTRLGLLGKFRPFDLKGQRLRASSAKLVETQVVKVFIQDSEFEIRASMPGYPSDD
jgi:hypothetical protein